MWIVPKTIKNYFPFGQSGKVETTRDLTPHSHKSWIIESLKHYHHVKLTRRDKTVPATCPTDSNWFELVPRPGRNPRHVQ